MRPSIRRAFALALAMTLAAPAFAAETAGRVADPSAGVARKPDIAAAATAIDALVQTCLAKHQQKPNPEIGDEVFLRRCYLDVVGRIPTSAEAIEFAKNDSPKRRRELIAKLIASEGWVSRQFDYLADLLRVESAPMKKYPGDPYIDWIKQSIRADMPYDRFVTALLTAQGRVLERGNGATGYYVRDAGMPQDNMSNTVQVFLGTRVSCAQCHDHPFDKWSRLQYMQMAAFTANVSEGPDPELVKQLRKLARSDGAPTQEEKQGLKRIADSVRLEVRGSDKDTIQLPKDYQYANAKPGQTVKAHAMFGDEIAIKHGESPRAAYAAWMTSPENPRFTTVIANRMWKRVMGLGLVEPLDNFTDATVASDPELLTHLTQLMKDVGYDLRVFEEILYNTKTYQRAVTTTEVDPGEPYYFPGPVLRRMSAEQAWDSLLTLVLPDVDERKGANAENQYATYDDMKDKTPKELWDVVTNVVDSIKKRKEIQDQLKELAAKTDDKRELAKNPLVRELRQQLQDLNEDAKSLGYAKKRQQPETDPRWKGYPRDLVRASELPSPAPPGHLLRDFGQSDRNLIENANASPAVTQALTLLNGVVDQHVLQPQSALMKSLEPISGQEPRIRATYLAILTRAPSAKELAMAMSAGAGRPNGTADLVWTLINSNEFLFVQ